MLLIIFLIPSLLNAGIINLIKENHAKPTNEITAIKEQNKKIQKLLENVTKDELVTWERKNSLTAGMILKGRLINSLLSSNLESPAIIDLIGPEFQGQKLHCLSVAQNQRIQINCHLLIAKNQNKKINAKILELDGSSGLKGITVSNGEFSLGKSILSSIGQGLSLLLGRQSESPEVQSLNVLKESAEEYSSNSLNSSKEKILVNGNREVLIYVQDNNDEG
jgi:hypothetical protein